MKFQRSVNAGTQNGNHQERLAVASKVKAGDSIRIANHNESLQVGSAVRAGGTSFNHNEVLRLVSQVKAGKVWPQHNETLTVGSRIRAGIGRPQHNESLQMRSDFRAGVGTPKNHNENLEVRSQVRAAHAYAPARRSANRPGDMFMRLSDTVPGGGHLADTPMLAHVHTLGRRWSWL
jgi:hypothetical protein